MLIMKVFQFLLKCKIKLTAGDLQKFISGFEILNPDLVNYVIWKRKSDLNFEIKY